MRKFLRNTIAYPLAPFFAAFLFLVFVLYLLLPQKNFSQKENRSLQTRPQLTCAGLASGTFMQKFETYTTEQLPFREGLVSLKAGMNRLTGSVENNGVVLGKDGYLFEKTYGTKAQLYQNEAAMLRFVQDANRPVTVAIVPNASEIEQDKLPYGFYRIDQKAEIQAFYRQLNGISVPASENETEEKRERTAERNLLPRHSHVVDITKALEEHKDEQLYYRTDHHWTTTAAYYAYEAICREMSASRTAKEEADDRDAKVQKPKEQRASIPDVVDITSIQKKEANDFYGTLYAKYRAGNPAPETLIWYEIPIVALQRTDGTFDSLYDPEKLKTYDKYAMFLRGNDEILTIRANHAGNRKQLVVFKDSYANCLIPFLTYQYDEITVVDLRYYADSVRELLEEKEDADILLLYNFSFLNEDNHFFRLTS